MPGTGITGLVLVLNGVVNANTLAFLLPGLIGVVAGTKEKVPWHDKQRFYALVLFAFGSSVLVLGISQTVMQNVK